MPRLVRRAPLLERVKAFLNPFDLLLWLSEELHDEAVDELLRAWTVPIAVFVNVLAIVTRAYSGNEAQSDLFGDAYDRRGGRWLNWTASTISFALVLLTVANALYTFLRARSYRLFEAAIDETPSTPSARRVAVGSSPVVSSPLRYIRSFISPAGPESRAHPDPQKHVWEVSVWDPKIFNLDLFTLFSPGHVMIYWMFFPTAAADPRPSVTIVTSIVVAALLSLQLALLKTKFMQQTVDNRVINKQVFNEYDTKFVRPALNRPVRDVGVQTLESATGAATKSSLVDIYTPTTHVRRTFEVNPNPSYVSHLTDTSDDSFSTPTARRLPRSSTTSSLLIKKPLSSGILQAAGNIPTPLRDRASTPLHQSHLSRVPSTLPQNHMNSRVSTPGPTRDSSYQSARRGDGGSLGIFSHAASPLKKAVSTSHLRPDRSDGRGMSIGGSPLKRSGLADSTTNYDARDRVGSNRLTQRFSNLQNRRETDAF